MSASRLSARSAGWAVFSNLAIAAIQLGQVWALTKILTPADFGVIAISNGIVMLAMTLQDLGFSGYVIHRQDLSRTELSSLYWFSGVTGAILLTVVFLVSFPVSAFYGNLELQKMLQILSANFLVVGLGSQPQALLQKGFLFKRLAAADVSSRVVTLIVAVVAAKGGWGPSAIAIGMLVGSVAKTLTLLLMARDSLPSFTFHASHIRPALRYGSFQMGGQIINMGALHLDSLILGKLITPADLGIYALAKELALRIALLVNPVAHRVALPAFARMQASASELARAYTVVLRIVSGVNGFGYAIVAIFSDTIILLLYGPAYAGCATFLSWLTLFGVLRSSINPIGALLQAVGRTNLEFGWNIVNLAVNSAFVGAAAFIGVWAVIVANIFAQLLLLALMQLLILERVLPLKRREYAKVVSPGAIIVLIGAVIHTVLSRNLLETNGSQIVTVAACLMIGLYGLWIAHFILKIRASKIPESE